MKRVEIYTDGACSGNPGPGGWGAILRYNGLEKELSGGEGQTTNNRMELTGAIMALEALKQSCEIDLYTDSRYLCDAFLKGWVDSWLKRGWKKAGGEKVLNIDLWQRLLKAMEGHDVRFHWVKSHAENPFNNRCDALAVSERDKYR